MKKKGIYRKGKRRAAEIRNENKKKRKEKKKDREEPGARFFLAGLQCHNYNQLALVKMKKCYTNTPRHTETGRFVGLIDLATGNRSTNR